MGGRATIKASKTRDVYIVSSGDTVIELDGNFVRQFVREFPAQQRTTVNRGTNISLMYKGRYQEELVSIAFCGAPLRTWIS